MRETADGIPIYDAVDLTAPARTWRASRRSSPSSPASSARNTVWTPPPGDVGGPENMFSSPVYTRGALTPQALRQKIGETSFTTLLRRWDAENKDGNVTTADFVALSEELSGQELDTFFDVWLYQPVKPTSW